MTITKFNIIFDQPDKIYHPGHTITGRVELVTESSRNVRGIKLKIKGKAKCRIYAKKSRFIENEVYINNEIFLHGEGKIYKLPRGAYSYPFALMLPQNVPSTYHADLISAKVVYYIRAKIDIPFAFNDTVKEKFTVENVPNLHNFPQMGIPSKTEKQKTYRWWCCGDGGLITFTVELPKTIFEKSESIPVKLEINNTSYVEVVAVICFLKRSTVVVAKGNYDEVSKHIQQLNFDNNIRSGESRTYKKNVAIPAIDFPNLEDCGLIKISYEVKIKAITSGCHFNIKIHAPIKIFNSLLNETTMVGLQT